MTDDLRKGLIDAIDDSIWKSVRESVKSSMNKSVQNYLESPVYDFVFEHVVSTPVYESRNCVILCAAVCNFLDNKNFIWEIS